MKYDAILVHGYWLSQKGESETVKLSLRSQLNVEAAAILVKTTRFLVLTVGHVWGEKYPPVASLMAEELVFKHHLPKNKIITVNQAVNTHEEIEIFLDLAKRHKWKNLASLASYAHFWTIPRIYDNKQISFTPLITEEIIPSSKDQRLINQVNLLQKSRYEFNYRLYQTAVWLALFFDPAYRVLGKLTRQSRNHKHTPAISNLFDFFKSDIYDV